MNFIFRLAKVHSFLVSLYGEEAISLEGLTKDIDSRKKHHNQDIHDLAIVKKGNKWSLINWSYYCHY